MADVARLARQHRAAADAVRRRVQTFVSRSWRDLGSWHEADRERWIAAVLPVVRGGQVRIAGLTDAYLAEVAAGVVGGGRRARGVPADVATGGRAASADEAYRRPFVEVWTALSRAKDLQAAVGLGGQRAVSLAATDLQLAQTHASRYVLSRDDRVAGFRRVPEGATACGLCLVASTQRYRRDDLMPIHPGCSCGVEPIYAGADPGQIIDPDILERTHEAIEKRFGVTSRDARATDYRKVLITREHGELGPVLTVKGQNFAGPGDLTTTP